MTEVKIADQDMYGYRTTGPNEPDTRVRVIAGQPVPPDLHSLEPTDDFKDQALYPDVNTARLTAEEQEALAKEREAAIAQPSQYNPDQPASDAPVNRGSRRERQERAKTVRSRSGQDEAVGE